MNKITKITVDYTDPSAISCGPDWDTKFEFPLGRLPEDIEMPERYGDTPAWLETIYRDCNAVDETSWILTENSGLRTRSMSVGDLINIEVDEERERKYTFRVESCGFRVVGFE